MTMWTSTKPVDCLIVLASAALLFAPADELSAATASSATLPPFTAASIEPTGHSITLETVGVIEVTGSNGCKPAVSEDARFSTAREQVERDVASADAARARLVREYLRVAQGPWAMLDLDQAEQDWEAERAQLHAARREITHAQAGLDNRRCTPADAPRIAGDPATNPIVEVRMELPAQYLRSLQQALLHGTDLISVYVNGEPAGHSVPAATGRLASLESTLAQNEFIVVARARVNDPVRRMRTGELVGVQVQLNQCTDADGDAPNFTGAQPC